MGDRESRRAYNGRTLRIRQYRSGWNRQYIVIVRNNLADPSGSKFLKEIMLFVGNGKGEKRMGSFAI